MEKYTEIIEENGFKAVITVEDDKIVSIAGDSDYFDIYTLEEEVKENYMLRKASVTYGHIAHFTGNWYIASGYIYLQKKNGVLKRSSRYEYEKEVMAWRRANPDLYEELETIIGVDFEESTEFSEEDWSIIPGDNEQEIPF